MPINVGERSLHEVDLSLAATDAAHDAHLNDFSAHTKNTFLRAHVDNSKRHVPSPPLTGTWTLKSVDGNLKWVTG